MKDRLEEFLVILSHSPKSQFALVLGVLFFIGIHVLGGQLLGELDMAGSLGPLMEAVQERLSRRYDMLAWFALGSFWLLALQLYLKDRKRFLSM